MTTSTDQHPKQAACQLGAADNDQDAVPARAGLTKVVVANVLTLVAVSFAAFRLACISHPQIPHTRNG